MANAGENLNASQFYITCSENLDSLDGKHTIFGEVAEGMDVVTRINETFCDDKGRPWQNVRIKHTIVLEDPFDDPPNLDDHIPPESPKLVRSADDDRLEDDWQPEEDTRPQEEIDKSVRTNEARSRAVVLEMIGDLPDAEARPEENLIFVCKLNPVTTEEDLEIIFSRFGKVTSCDVVKDWKTGESLCYAFIGFETNAAAEQAYFKMDNVLIDDRRIHVDFYQSMHHQWRMYKRTGKFDPKQKEVAAAVASSSGTARHPGTSGTEGGQRMLEGAIGHALSLHPGAGIRGAGVLLATGVAAPGRLIEIEGNAEGGGTTGTAETIGTGRARGPLGEDTPRTIGDRGEAPVQAAGGEGCTGHFSSLLP
eukprot:CAMPEP_0198244236 /NCGR_PEP_ID=MMETSP1446-20131203/33733_1 /TAXON_ID=1461542 ORGANISM="Unidentified sp, Strain CCMP2111" /NCGR_SAMPLE_ID=MMETSP1446 /ASSEMBLY_ACC=CAM_ASM_001112 /LENGTH=364 /DNA_ID=CAMNT_0043928235 /DNA_START=18 /DNA_END=1113 /DNA_ORIENTATION=-